MNDTRLNSSRMVVARIICLGPVAPALVRDDLITFTSAACDPVEQNKMLSKLPTATGCEMHWKIPCGNGILYLDHRGGQHQGGCQHQVTLHRPK